MPHFIEGAFTLFDTDKYGNAYYRFIEDGKIQQELVVSSEGYFLSFGETAYAIEGGPLGYYPVENSVQFGISNQSSSLGSAPNLQSAFSSAASRVNELYRNNFIEMYKRYEHLDTKEKIVNYLNNPS